MGLLSALGTPGDAQGPGAFDPAPAQALAAAQSSAAQSALIASLNGIGNAQLERRAVAVGAITTKEAVERRQAEVRRTSSLGMVALHAAALDERITSLFVERTLVSYRMALDAGLHKNLSEALIPDVLKHYDVGDLLMAIHPRPVVLVSPATPMGQLARGSVVREQLAAGLRSRRAPLAAGCARYHRE